LRPSVGQNIHPAFPRILRELTSLEARCLDFLVPDDAEFRLSSIKSTIKEFPDFDMAAATNLERLGLITLDEDENFVKGGWDYSPNAIAATAFGRLLVRACREVGLSADAP
jgi:hypothetical protein